MCRMVEIMELVLIVLRGGWITTDFVVIPSGIETYSMIAGLLGLAQFSMYLEDRTLWFLEPTNAHRERLNEVIFNIYSQIVALEQVWYGGEIEGEHPHT